MTPRPASRRASRRRSTSPASRAAANSAGALPNSTPVATETPRLQSSTAGDEGYVGELVERRGPQRDDDAQGEPRDADAEQPTREREQQPLGEHLPREPPASCAKRATHGELALSRPRAGQQEVGDVRAGDEQ